jgi:hypothetical protein
LAAQWADEWVVRSAVDSVALMAAWSAVGRAVVMADQLVCRRVASTVECLVVAMVESMAGATAVQSVYCSAAWLAVS